MSDNDVTAYLTHLAVNKSVAINTQKQALNALVFLFKKVLKHEHLALDGFSKAKKQGNCLLFYRFAKPACY